MDTQLLYLEDQYLKECDGKVIFFEFTDLIVDKTVFYPTGEGQPNDRGKVIIGGKEYAIVDTWQDGTNVHLMSHDTFPDDVLGKPVHQVIDWNVRYAHMKFRTALRIISGLAFKLFNATTRINQTYDDQAWIDLEIPEVTEEMIKDLEERANKVVSDGVEVKTEFVSKEEFMKDENLMKISKSRVPDFDSIRLVSIDELPLQPEIGTNVKNTREIGKIEFKTSLVKGKISNRITVLLP